MRTKWVILAIVILVIAASLYYALKPEPAVPLETQEIITELCISEAQNFHSYAKAVNANDPELCEENYLKPVCLAKISIEDEICAEEDLLCNALLGAYGGCSELGFQRFACEAVRKGDLLYFESDQLEKDCKELATLEAALESRKKRNCKQVKNTILRSECNNILLKAS